MLACTNTDGGLHFRRRRHHPSSEKNRTEQVGGEEGKEGTIMVRLQSMRQCSVVHNAGMGTGWEQLSRIHFDCVQNASEHNTFAGLLRAYAPPQTNRLGILLCAKRGGPMPWPAPCRHCYCQPTLLTRRQIYERVEHSECRSRSGERHFLVCIMEWMHGRGGQKLGLFLSFDTATSPLSREPVVLFSFSRPLPS